MQMNRVLAGVFCLLCAWRSTMVVNEGEVGIHYLFGSLLNATHCAGMHIDPYFIIGRLAYIDIRPQTDQVLSVACGTADGLSLVFENVDVGNTLPEEHVLDTIRKYGESYDSYLVKDKIRHQMQVICASMTSHEVFNTRFHEIDDLLQEFLVAVNQQLNSGLVIDFVRLSKPMIPPGIRNNYEKLAEEKTMLKVESEKQERLKKEAETKHMLLVSALELTRQQSQMDSQIATESAQSENKIKYARGLAEDEIKYQHVLAAEDRSKIENRIEEEKAKTYANVQQLHALALHELHSVHGYIELQLADKIATAIGPNAKLLFFGDVPHFLPNSLFSNTTLIN